MAGQSGDGGSGDERDRLLDQMGQCVALMQARTAQFGQVSQALEARLGEMAKAEAALEARLEKRLKDGAEKQTQALERVWRQTALKQQVAGRGGLWTGLVAIAGMILLVSAILYAVWMWRQEQTWRADLVTAQQRAALSVGLDRYLRGVLYDKLNETRQSEIDAVYEQHGFKSPGSAGASK